MTDAQTRHMEEIAAAFVERIRVKYAKGAAEHNSNLFDMPLLALIDNALDEAIDQVTYLLTARTEALRLNGLLGSLAGRVAAQSEILSCWAEASDQDVKSI